MMTAPARRVHGTHQIVTHPHQGDAVADEHTYTLTIEASGDVTPAHPVDETTEPAPEEVEQ